MCPASKDSGPQLRILDFLAMVFSRLGVQMPPLKCTIQRAGGKNSGREGYETLACLSLSQLVLDEFEAAVLWTLKF